MNHLILKLPGMAALNAVQHFAVLQRSPLDNINDSE